MRYERDRKKRRRDMDRWVKKFLKYGLTIAFIALLLWWLMHLFGDMQSTIIGLQDQVNQQNLQISKLQNQLQSSLEENDQLKVKINGLTKYIIDQNNVIQDLKGQLDQSVEIKPQIDGEAYIESEEEINSKENNNFKDFVTSPGATLAPIVIGALEIGRRLLMPGRILMGGF